MQNGVGSMGFSSRMVGRKYLFLRLFRELSMGKHDKWFWKPLLVILLENESAENGALCEVRRTGPTRRHNIGSV